MRLHTTESPQKGPISIKNLMARGSELPKAYCHSSASDASDSGPSVTQAQRSGDPAAGGTKSEKRQDSRDVPVDGEGSEAEGPARGSQGKRASLRALVMRQELEKLMFGN